MLLDKRPEVIAAGKRRLKGRSGIQRQPSLVRLGNFGSLFCVSYRGA